MKKTLLTLAIVLAGFATMNAQKGSYYVYLSGGPTYKAGTNELSKNANHGSFGEGIEAQLRGAYFFSDTFGVDLGVGYLHGDSQNVSNSGGIDINAKSRAFGASLTGVVNLSENVYFRAGLLTKLGGKTLVDGSVSTPGVKLDFERENRGSFPLGFTGAFGVKHMIGNNWGIFAEAQYQGINVPAEKSTLKSLSGSLGGVALSKEQIQGAVGNQLQQLLLLQQANPNAPQLAALPQVARLNSVVSNELTYSDNPSTATELPSFDAPYSSFGFSFGVMYRF